MAAARRASEDGLPGRRRLAAILALSLGTLVASLDNGGVNIALPTLAHELNIAPSATVLVVTVYQLILIMTVLPFSALGDRIGHRTLFQFGQAVFVIAPLLCFFVRSLPALVLIRGIQALGAAATFSVSTAMLRSIYPRARLGRGMALNTMVAATSASLAPTIGGMVLSVAPWPWLFAVCAPLALLSIGLGRKALPDPHRQSAPYDLAAALMCAVTIGLAVVGLESAVHGGSPAACAGLIGAALVVGTAFVRRELRQTHPVFPVDLLRDPAMALGSAGSLLANLATTTVMLTLPFRLQREFGYSPAEAGLVLAAWPMVMMVVAPASGMLSDRVPAARLGGVGMAIALAGMAALAGLPAAPDHLDVIWRIGLAAVGFGLFLSPNARQILAAAPTARAAAAGALSQTTRLAGQVLGSTTAAALLAGGVGAGAIPSLVAASLAGVTGLCCLGLGLTLAERLRHAEPA
ncbi:MFS transporter [Phenylobacterium sp. LjRoot225]|uniref:MFS transporter n=1 Tax=Phenylobacterium sp. LjRoot225 TaxID=3342285 RepID=UPI003ED147A8